MFKPNGGQVGRYEIEKSYINSDNLVTLMKPKPKISQIIWFLLNSEYEILDTIGCGTYINTAVTWPCIDEYNCSHKDR